MLKTKPIHGVNERMKYIVVDRCMQYTLHSDVLGKLEKMQQRTKTLSQPF